MTLPTLRLCFYPHTAILTSAFLLMSGCAAQTPTSEKGQLVASEEIATLSPSLSLVPKLGSAFISLPTSNLSVDPVPITSDAIDPSLNKPASLKPVPKDKKIAEVIKANSSTANKKHSNSVAFLLGEAGWAFEKDKLTTPKGQNAYFFITKVLSKDPGNPKAFIALEKIVQRYYVLLRASLKQGKVEQARVFWSRAKTVKPKHDQLKAMKNLIDDYVANQDGLDVIKVAAPTSYSQPGPVTAAPVIRTQKLLLPLELISQKNEKLAAWLVTLAQDTQMMQATMLIVAPKDNQARWVYKVMNGADPEQRIRANIKRSRPARIEVTYRARKDELEVYSN
jgi:Tfp pilus assembly protein PilN